MVQGYNLSPCLFNIFTGDITSIIIKENAQETVLGNQTIPVLLFADNLAIGSFTWAAHP